MWMECLYCLFPMLLRCKPLIRTKLCCVFGSDVVLQLLQQRSACGALMAGGPMDPSVFKLGPPLDESPDATAESFCVALPGRLLW